MWKWDSMRQQQTTKLGMMLRVFIVNAPLLLDENICSISAAPPQFDLSLELSPLRVGQIDALI